MLRNFEVINELKARHGIEVRSSQQLNKIFEGNLNSRKIYPTGSANTEGGLKTKGNRGLIKAPL
jgi:hypothetical protein